MPSQPPPRSGEPTDRQLLAQLSADADREAAMQALIERHGPLVLSACRRNTHCSADAEDAFQATFLLLTQKGDRLRRSEALAAWLYGVVLRVCLRVRRDYSRHPTEPLGEEPTVSADPLDELLARHDGMIADEELTALPAKLRTPMVLRYLSGYSNNAAAAELGISVAALEGRLKRAKQQLRARLVRRGVTLAAFVATLKATRVEAGDVPDSLTAATTQLTVGSDSQPLSTSAPATPLYQLALGELVAMNAPLIPKPLITAAALCGVATLVVGAPFAMSQPAASDKGIELVAEAIAEMPAAEPPPAVPLQPATSSPGSEERLGLTEAPLAEAQAVVSFLATEGKRQQEKRRAIVLAYLQDVRDRARKAEEEFSRLAREAGSTQAPGNAVLNQLGIEQIGRLQDEILTVRRGVAEGDLKKEYLKELLIEVEELTESVAYRSDADIELRRRRREIDALNRIEQDLARRVELMKLDLDFTENGLVPESANMLFDSDPSTLAPSSEGS